MNNSKFNEAFSIVDSSKNSLKYMNELLSGIERLDDKSIEKTQCIQAMCDNIEMLMSQMNKIDVVLKDISSNSKDNSYPVFCDSFKMRDMKVLIVDDNEINNYVVGKMLSEFGIDVDVATSGLSALEKVQNNEYDIIFMDYLMPPGIDGVETVKRIREMGEKGEKQLIIGLTANTIKEFKDGLNKYGVELILFKPVKYQQMMVILQKEFPDKIFSCNFTELNN